MLAFVGFARLTTNDSFGSLTMSPTIVTATVLVVCPAANVRTPEAD